MNYYIRILFLTLLIGASAAFGQVRGIYITTSTMEDTNTINYLIQRSKATGINTFVVDYERGSSAYRKNIALLKQHGIHYVARIVVFPEGGTADRVKSIPYRENKYQLMKNAVALGAESIQLDYIRYNTSQGRSAQHAIDVNNVIAWFRQRLNVPLEVDVFGITSFGPEHHIGQDVRLFAKNVDVICPMNYPSHFQPFAPHSARPRATVFNALEALKDQFNDKVPVKVIAWIEMSNYHYILTGLAKQKYIAAQIRAVDDANVTGWYAWSPNNQYNNLFRVLETKQQNMPHLAEY